MARACLNRPGHQQRMTNQFAKSARPLAFLLSIGIFVVLGGAGWWQNRALPAPVPNDSYQFFDVRLTIPSEGVESLRKWPRHRVAAKLQLDHGEPLEVEIRLKGRGSFRPIDRQPSFTVRVKGTLPASAPFLARKFYLHNNVQDPSLLADYFSRRIYNHVGLSVGKLAFAWLKLNGGEGQGYTLVEAVDREFFEKRMATESVEYFELDRADQGEAKGDKMLRYATATYDQETLRRIIAADYLTANDDGFCFAINNAWVYKTAAQEQWRVMPHTSDTTFNYSESVLRREPVALPVTRLMQDRLARKESGAYLLNTLHSVGVEQMRRELNQAASNLLNDIAKRSIQEARQRCNLVDDFKRRVDMHFENLETAFALDEGRQYVVRTFTNALGWQGKLGPAVSTHHPRGDKLTFSAEKPVAQILYKSHFLIVPGRYAFELNYRCEFKKQPGGEKSLGMLSVGDTFHMPLDLSPGEHRANVGFEVKQAPSKRLFESETCAITIELNNFVGACEVPLNKIRLVRITDELTETPKGK